MKITGQTKIIGVIGDPVEHSRSPQMHNAVIHELGLDYVYVPFHVATDQIGHAVEGFKALKVVGINITLPHKKSVLPLMDKISREAELIGAVNTMVFEDGKVEGHNTDARGFINSLNEEGVNSVRGMNVLILGAGGASQAVVAGLAIERVANITIANRTVEKAVNLADEIGSKTDISVKGISLDDSRLLECASECDLLVSTVTSGMDTSIEPVINPNWLNKDCIVCDIVYTPPETNLLKAAKKRGLKTIGGMGMLVHQGAISFELWTGIKPSVETMRKALVQALFGD